MGREYFGIAARDCLPANVTMVDAQRRLYRLKPEPLQEVDAWLAPFRWIRSHRGCATGFSSGFDQVLPISFASFDTLVDHQYARLNRYTSRDIEHEVEQTLDLSR